VNTKEDLGQRPATGYGGGYGPFVSSSHRKEGAGKVFTMVRTFARVAAILLLAGLGSVAGTAGASAQAPSARSITAFAGEFHPIKNLGNTNSCLQPQSPNFGARIVQVTCNGSREQNWAFLETPTGSTRYRFLNTSGLCMFAPDNPVDRSPVFLDECRVQGGSSVSNAEWNSDTRLPNAAMLRTFVNSRDRNLCLDEPDASSAEGLAMQLFTCNGSGAQRWIVGF
jgi:hypothetical protein